MDIITGRAPPKPTTWTPRVPRAQKNLLLRSYSMVLTCRIPCWDPRSQPPRDPGHHPRVRHTKRVRRPARCRDRVGGGGVPSCDGAVLLLPDQFLDQGRRPVDRQWVSAAVNPPFIGLSVYRCLAAGIRQRTTACERCSEAAYPT